MPRRKATMPQPSTHEHNSFAEHLLNGHPPMLNIQPHFVQFPEKASAVFEDMQLLYETQSHPENIGCRVLRGIHYHHQSALRDFEHLEHLNNQSVGTLYLSNQRWVFESKAMFYSCHWQEVDYMDVFSNVLRFGVASLSNPMICLPHHPDIRKMALLGSYYLNA